MEDILASIRRILSEDEPAAARKPVLTPHVPTQAAPPPSEPSDDVLMLDESMLVQEPPHAAPVLPPSQPLLHASTPFAALGSFMSAPTQPDVTPAHLAAHLAPPPEAAPAPPPEIVVPPAPAAPPVEIPPANLAAHFPPNPAPVVKAEPMADAPTAAAGPHSETAPLVAPEATAAAAASMGTLLRTLSAERQTPVYRGGPSIEDIVRDEMRPMLKEWLDNNLPSMVERLVRLEIERMVGHAKL